MQIPGFTAEAAFDGSVHGQRQKYGVVPTSKGAGRVLPAIRTPLHSAGKVKSFCKQSGGLYLPKTGTSSTYGCLRDDGSGIVCGGVTKDQKKSCDTF